MPSILALVLFIFIPFILTLLLSFFDYSPVLPYRTGSFIGLENYATVFKNKDFYNSLFLTAKFILSAVSFEIIFGTLIAYWLFRNINIAKLLLPILIIPPAIPPITTALLWKLLLQSNHGILTYYLSLVLNTNELAILGDATSAFTALILIDIWQWTPLVIILIYIGLRTLYMPAIEAAYIDGASKIKTFFDIILPQILPFIVVCSILRILDSIKEFEKIYILTGGGPGNQTEFINMFLWRINFKFWENGIGSAMTILVYLLTLILLFFMFNRLQKVLRWDS